MCDIVIKKKKCDIDEEPFTYEFLWLGLELKGFVLQVGAIKPHSSDQSRTESKTKVDKGGLC